MKTTQERVKPHAEHYAKWLADNRQGKPELTPAWIIGEVEESYYLRAIDAGFCVGQALKTEDKISAKRNKQVLRNIKNTVRQYGEALVIIQIAFDAGLHQVGFSVLFENC